MPFKDPEAARKYKAEYHQKHKVEHRAARNAWVKRNRPKRNAYIKAWRRRRALKCREYVARYKAAHPDRIKAYNARPEVKKRKLEHGRAIYKRNQEIKNRIKAQGCVYCGEDDPVCLDFHHRNPAEKEANARDLATWSTLRLLRELAKCDVVCANCHRKIHRKDGKKWSRRAALLKRKQRDSRPTSTMTPTKLLSGA